MKKLLFYSLPFLLAISSCRKNPLPPEDESGEPVFYVTFKVKNGSEIITVQKEAGKNDYFMYSSHYQQANGVYVYKGELKQTTSNNCIDCYGISFLINDFKVSAKNEAMKPDSGLYAGSYVFNDGVLPPWGYNVTFNSPAPSSALFNWSYGDGKSSGLLGLQQGGNSVNHFYKPGIYWVTLKDSLPSSSFTSHTNVFNVGNDLQTNITSKRVDPLTVFKYEFSATPSKPGVTSYYWDFGDGHTSSDPNPSHVFANPQPVSSMYYQIIKLQMVNGNDTCNSYYQLPVTSNLYPFHANYTAAFSMVPNNNALSAITIQVTEPLTGVVFSSGTIDQSTTSKFEIVSVEDYKTNDAGNKTKKVKIKFSCKAINGPNTSEITDGEAVIAVSYK